MTPLPVLFSATDPPFPFSPKGGLERLKIALWAILANRPACRVGFPQAGSFAKPAHRAGSLRLALPVGEGWVRGLLKKK